MSEIMRLRIKSFLRELNQDIDLAPLNIITEWRLDLVSLVIRWQRAKARSGTHSTKIISEVSGTTRKPYRQKGTGNARQGSLRSVQMRGGGISFGPVPRDHSHKINKKIRTLALKSIISDKIFQNRLMVFDSFENNFQKTKEFESYMNNAGMPSALLVAGDLSSSQNLKQVVSNLSGYDFLPVGGINVLDIASKDFLILDKLALSSLEKRFS